jgi:1-acyl-sn-glycerol-3-phosphate acyltransferase
VLRKPFPGSAALAAACPRRGLADRLLWLITRVTIVPLLHLPPLRMRRRGTGHLPRTGPVPLVCDHVSIADPLVLAAAARPRRTAMMAKSELFRSAPLRRYLRGLRAFPVRRAFPDLSAVRLARDLVERGECVVVFRGAGSPAAAASAAATRPPGCWRCAPGSR